MLAYILVLTIINPLYGQSCISDRECFDNYCDDPQRRRLVGDYPIGINDFGPNFCARCCPGGGGDVCTETFTGDQADGCGRFSEIDGVSYALTVAPCCDGEVCLDNTLGICGTLVGECEPCTTWNTQQADFLEAPERLSNCEEGLICLIDDSPGADVTMTDHDYFTYTYGDFFGELTDQHGPHPRRLQSSGLHQDFYGKHWDFSFDIKSLRAHVTVSKGICVAEDGISTETATCDVDGECPTCMRCCAGNDGIKKCIRNIAGEVCGLSFEGRGPCCCPGTCKSNECITPAPTQAPITPAPTNDDHSGSDEEIFNAEQMSGLTDNNNNSGNNGYMWTLSDKAVINLWGVVLVFIFVVFIPTIILKYCCYKKRGNASFKNDIDEINGGIDDV